MCLHFCERLCERAALPLRWAPLWLTGMMLQSRMDLSTFTHQPTATTTFVTVSVWDSWSNMAEQMEKRALKQVAASISSHGTSWHSHAFAMWSKVMRRWFLFSLSALGSMVRHDLVPCWKPVLKMCRRWAVNTLNAVMISCDDWIEVVHLQTVQAVQAMLPFVTLDLRWGLRSRRSVRLALGAPVLKIAQSSKARSCDCDDQHTWEVYMEVYESLSIYHIFIIVYRCT